MDTNSQTFTTDRIENRKVLLAGIDRIREVLLSQCEAEEVAATLSSETVDSLSNNGFLTMKLPAVLGGAEADPITQFEVLEGLAGINAAASWCTMVGATALGLPGAFLPDAGVAEMFGPGHIPRGAICIMPAGVARPVDGGYLVSGRWSFASGIRHSEWITALSSVVRVSETVQELRMMVFRTAIAKIHDNWRVMGLKGTGSCDFSVADIYVPETMSWNIATDKPRRGGALYYLGIPAFVANEHAAFACGVGRRALDILIELAESKKRGYSVDNKNLGNKGTVQSLIGRSEITLRAARALTIELNERAWNEVCRGNLVPTRLQSELRSAATYCTEVATTITTQAFRCAGASVVYEHDTLQRCLRDINVAAQHLLVSENSFENLGKITLGFPNVNPMG